MSAVKPTLFLILDGYGLAPAGPGNAASLANTPTLDRLFSMPGMGRLDASGRQVGLPAPCPAYGGQNAGLLPGCHQIEKRQSRVVGRATSQRRDV